MESSSIFKISSEYFWESPEGMNFTWQVLVPQGFIAGFGLIYCCQCCALILMSVLKNQVAQRQLCLRDPLGNVIPAKVNGEDCERVCLVCPGAIGLWCVVAVYAKEERMILTLTPRHNTHGAPKGDWLPPRASPSPS